MLRNSTLTIQISLSHILLFSTLHVASIFHTSLTCPLTPSAAAAEYSEEELYPYATTTFPMGGASPPPPAPPTPPTHAHDHTTFTVYVSPSIHDVDSANLVGDNSVATS